MKLFELTIDDENEDGVFALSFVSDPAIELYGTFFDKEQVLLSELEEQGLFMAPILVPNKRILRVDGKGEAYEVFFTEKTIKRLSQMYLEKKYQDSVTVEHGNEKVDGIVLTESWIKESATKDKSNLYNLNAPKGSWMGTFRVENEEVKEKLRNGDISAISIEGIFEHMEREFAKEQIVVDKDIEDFTEEEADEFLRLLRNLIFGNTDEVKLESYTDYPKQATENAKIALRWADENGWGSCGTPVGKQRANQLAKGEAISEETIARMASFERQRQNSDKELGDGCGRLMWLAWGGDAGVEWAQRKLEQIRGEKLEVGVPHYTADGELYEGPTHKDASGRLMTGATHTEDSEYLYHKEELEAQPSISSSYPGEKAEEMITPNPCQDGYVAIGMKTKNGRKVPNCVPKD